MLEKGRKNTRRKAASGAKGPLVSAIQGSAAQGPAAQRSALQGPAVQGIASQGIPTAAAGRTVSQAEPTSSRPVAISAEERRRMIAEAAYYRAERRGPWEGDPNSDWFEAEAEIDAMLLDRR